MSVPERSSTDSHPHSDELNGALFAQLVMQQANMAMMLLGKVPHPESGQTVLDVDAARFFIDQLQMLETKTKGNLTKEESALLKQSLMSLRLAFVETVETPANRPSPQGSQPSPLKPADKPTELASTAGLPAESEDEHRKKFSKKY